MAMTLKPVSITASATLKRNVHKGVLTTLDAAAGLTVTLPSATGSGDQYPVAVGTTVTSNAYVLAAPGSDILAGVVSVANDIAGVTCPTTATSDKMTLNGGTTGGLRGSKVVFTDIASGVWMVEGALHATGAEATPFSAS